MVFANPSYLWALWGLLVPLAIHLWSKKEAKTIKIGSIQLLDESNSRQSSSIQMNEWLLLLLRMLIVGLVVLLMAGPQWRTYKNKDQVTYLVEPSLADDPTLTKFLDSLDDTSAVLLLKSGFPEWELDMEELGRETPNYWQLVQKMDSLPSDSIVIFAHAYLQGFKSMRPTAHKKIHWVAMEPQNLEPKPLMAFRNGQDTELLSIAGNGQNTYFKKEALSSGFSLTENGDSLLLDTGIEAITVGFIEVRPITVHIFSETRFEAEKKYVEAALKALSSYLDRDIERKVFVDNDQPENSRPDLNIWLRTDPSGSLSGKRLMFRENPLAEQLIAPGEQNGLYYLTEKLTTQNTVEEHFAEQLLGLLDVDADLEDLIAESDFRQMDGDELMPNYVEPKKKRDRATFQDMSHWMFLGIAILMLLERLVSYFKKQ